MVSGEGEVEAMKMWEVRREGSQQERKWREEGERMEWKEMRCGRK